MEEQLQQELVAVKALAFDKINSLERQVNSLQGSIQELLKLAGVETAQELADMLAEQKSE